MPFGIVVFKSFKFALFALILVAPLLALDPSKTLTQYAHRIWGQEEGLFQPTLYSILQTRDGFLWLGTQDSLIRFDGSHFREFGDPADPAFHRSLIRALHEDPEGNLWVGSVGGGVARITPSGTVSRFTIKEGLPSDSVFCVDPDAGASGLWFCTSLGLAHWDGSRFHVYTKADGLASNEIRATCDAGNGVRWVAGLNFGLSRIVDNHVEPYTDPLIAERDGVTALLCARDGSVWVGTNAGVAHIEMTGQGTARPKTRVTRLFTVRDGLTDNAVSSLLEGPDGTLWIGGNDGISRFRNGQISVYRTRDGLSHSVVLSLYFDREGTLWAGTKDGLDQFADGKVTPYTTDEGLSGNSTGPVLEDQSGRLWIGTLGNGLDYFDGARFHSLTTRNGLSDNAVLSLERNPSGGLWVGTRNGLNRLENGNVTRVYTRADGLPGSEIRSLFTDSQGVLWAGSDRGLARFTGTKFEAFPLNPAAPVTGIVALGGSSLTQLFISTDSAGFYALRNGFLTASSPDLPRPVDCYFFDRSHPNARPGALHRTAWMGTLGSSLLGWHNGAFVHVRVKDGLYDNRIYSILEDAAANLWMASSKGIFRIAKQDLDDFADHKRAFIESIPFSTGQLRFECQSGVQPAAWRAHDGRLWFSTTNGLVVVDPNHLAGNRIPPPVQITAAIVDGQRVANSRDLELKPSQENLEIRYAGLTFIAPEKVSFRYILDGFDKKWTEAGARREAFFTNLRPGHYRFKVLARNADGVWSTHPATLNFTIQPRLYQRIWFLPCLALLIALAIVLGYRLRIRHLSLRFELVLAERNRIARELHDTLLQGLSGITMQLQALWIKMGSSKEKQFLGEVIKDAGRCSQEARQSLWGLRSSVGSSGDLDFSERLAQTAQRTVASKPIALSLHLQSVSLRAVPEIEFQLLRIAHEVVSNAVSHARASRLEIRLAVEDQILRLTIGDNGIGFEPAAPQRLGHYGLTGIQERASEIGADLRLITSPGAGTKVEISLPFARLASSTSNAETGFAHQLQ